MYPIVTEPIFSRDGNKALFLCDNQGKGTIYVTSVYSQGDYKYRQIFRFREQVKTYETNGNINSEFYFSEVDKYTERNQIVDLLRTDRFDSQFAIENYTMILTDEIVTIVMIEGSVDLGLNDEGLNLS